MVASAPIPPDKLMKCNPASSFNSSSGDTATAGSFLQALPLHPPAARAAPWCSSAPLLCSRPRNAVALWQRAALAAVPCCAFVAAVEFLQTDLVVRVGVVHFC